MGSPKLRLGRLVVALLLGLCVGLPRTIAAQATNVGYTFLRVGQRVPLEVVNRQHAVCYPPETNRTSLQDFDFTQNGDVRKITVIAHYYTGCNPGREDAPLYALLADMYLTLQRGKVAFLQTLKNGVNNHICSSWANLGGNYSKGMPYIVDDQDRSLAFAFFEGPHHPEYVILDHCMNVAARLGSLTNGTKEIDDTLKDLISKLGNDCAARAADDVAPIDKCYRLAGDAAPAACQPDYVAAASVTATCAPLLGAQSMPQAVATAEHGLATPRDVNFHPLTGELYMTGQEAIERSQELPSAVQYKLSRVPLGSFTVANSATDGMIVLEHVDPADEQPTSSRVKADRAPYHYMASISSFSFGRKGWFATCQESTNTYNGMKRPNYFMGPTLYETVQTEGMRPVNVDQRGLACGDAAGAASSSGAAETCFFWHSDMLHSVPQCMGMAYDPEDDTPFQNVYWAFDGFNGTLIRYDFESPHYPGSLAHELANVRRYTDIQLTRVPDTVGHIVVDKTPHTVYVADTGGNRIIALDADSGRFNQHARADLGGAYNIWSANQSSFEYSVYTCARFVELAKDIAHPSGLALHGNILYVASHATGEIHALHKTTGATIQTFATGAAGIMGLAVSLDGTKLYYADAPANQVMVLQISQACDQADTLQGTGIPPIAYASVDCPAPERQELGLAVVDISHDDGYLNMTMLGPEYGESEDCKECNDSCDNDMLLMSGYLCHQCLPNPCNNGGTCTNLIGQGYFCTCSSDFTGDHCQREATAPTSTTGSPPLAVMTPTSSSSPGFAVMSVLITLASCGVAALLAL